MSLPADRLIFQEALVASAREHVALGAQGVVVGVSQDVFERRRDYDKPSLHPDAAFFSVVCVYAIVDPALGRNIAPERLARTALERAGLRTLGGARLALENSVETDGCHPHVLPEYHELHAVAGWDAVGVAALMFRLEENLRRLAAGDTRKCSMCGEFWSNVIGRGHLTYAVYMVSTIHET